LLLYFYVYTDDEWKQEGFLDDEKKPSADSSIVKTAAAAARDIFKAKATTGQEKKKDGDVLVTQHSNVITCIANAGPAGDKLTRISTTSLDGRLVVWDLNSLSSSFGALKL